MKYISTRGDTTARGFCDILLEGLAPDGGLYLPTHYPRVDAATLQRWRGLAYADLAFEILSLYIDDIPPAEKKTNVKDAYKVKDAYNQVRGKCGQEMSGEGAVKQYEVQIER